ncbi:MAG: imidazole glycerol phosphate synthase subunit HisH, partial [Candidatus Magasanikbacteria bacterium]|nr:imidazole glycerol phosphate synthase subunit HisH [Candidatus Magasanikbacteria bacterium]
PGVGAFTAGMSNIRAYQLEKLLVEMALEKKVPFLGICLGMQLLASTGFEGGETPGLGWIPGEVRRLEPKLAYERVPHVGWNEVLPVRELALLADIAPNTDFYFVHSFHFVCANAAHLAATTPYAGGFTSVVERENIWGVQFHPEKSQRPGFKVLKNFLAL